MYRYLPILIWGLAFFAVSCNSGGEEVPVDSGYKRVALPDDLPTYDSIPKPADLQGYGWETMAKTVTETGCEATQCSEISWQWFVLNEAPNSALKDSLWAFSWHYLTGIPGAREIDLDSIAASFFKEAKKDVPPGQMAPAWAEDNSVWPVAATANTFTLGGWIYGNYGNAQGNHASHLENFDVATGNRLTLKDVVEQPYEVIGLGEQIFRKQKGVADGTSLTDAGFTFQDGMFYLPETFGVLPDGLLFVYVPYEIASYAEGEQYLFIPYSLLAEGLNAEYQYLVTPN